MFSCFANENGKYVMSQYTEMLRLLDNFESKITKEWNQMVTRRIPELLVLNLMLRSNKLLAENFQDDVQFVQYERLFCYLYVFLLKIRSVLRETRTQIILERDDISPIAQNLFRRDNDLYVIYYLNNIATKNDSLLIIFFKLYFFSAH